MDDARRCHARAKTTGQQCKRAAIPGGTVCAKHGGAAPQVQTAAQRRQDEAHLRQTVETLGLPIDVDPSAALLGEVHRTAGHVAWIGAQVQALDPTELTWGLTQVSTGGGKGTVATETTRIHPLIDLYQRERAHLVKASAAAIRCGVAQRQVELAEAHGTLIADVLRSVLDDAELNLDPDRRQIAERVVHRHLMAIAGGAL